MRRAAVLGSPVEHSLSPVLHRAAYDALGLDWTYDAVDVDAAGLAGYLDGLDASWVGLSLTMPLKQAVLTLLDAVTPLATAVGSVNTVLLGDEGRTGFNTDVPGIAAALNRMGVSLSARVSSATLLGGGATAASAVAALAGLCAGPVTVFLRRPEAASRLVQMGAAFDVEVRTAPWSEAEAGLQADLVVATTPATATDELARRVPAQPGRLFDVLYDPWPTPLAAAWSAAGGRVGGGLDLLVEQAAPQVTLMTGQPAPLERMRTAGERALEERGRTGAPVEDAAHLEYGSP